MPEYVRACPATSVAAQNVELGQDTELGLCARVLCGADHVYPSYSSALPTLSTAMQNLELAHETEVK